jgi:hypothetical protein
MSPRVPFVPYRPPFEWRKIHHDQSCAYFAAKRSPEDANLDEVSAEAGAEMLAKGGNAIDAAAAVQFALNDEEPKMTGIGGSAFIIIYLAKQKKVFVIDLQTGRVFSAADPRRDSTVIYGKGGENNLAKPKK